jgi:prolyl-tRNA editing enzyme YbaK/EbsC (Cys-tRNA(Pro) deacylase)/ubiquinone/menaquinone biosynthesis C-methylase UbiE
MGENWEKGKEHHRQLADVAAFSYDDQYSESNFATGLYMEYETGFIRETIEQCPDTDIAVEFGCGTGRHSFILAEEFEQVRGYDFSEQMISVAERRKHERGIGNVAFEARDVEKPLLEDDASVSLVIASFGMASFVQNLHELLRKIRRILKPEGMVILSFYNSDSLVINLKNDLPWRGLSLSATYNTETERLEVQFGDDKFDISAKTYSYDEIENVLLGNFVLEDIVTYPTMSAILPEELFENSEAQEICKTVDLTLAHEDEIAGGAYILARCMKGGDVQGTDDIIGLEKILRLFRLHEIEPEYKEHAPAHSLEELATALGAPPSKVVKSVIFVHERDGEKTYHATVLTADNKVHVGKLADVLELPREHLRMATQQEVEEIIGFHIHHLPPFGFPNGKSVSTVLDVSLEDHDEIWCSIGKRTEHVKITVDELKTLTSTFVFSDINK